MNAPVAAALASGKTMGNSMKLNRKLRVALVGGGIGGLTTAIALNRNGFETQVFEQADELREVGAGIGISPNAVKVLRALGLEDALKERGLEAEAIIGRDWTTARPLFRLERKGVAGSRFGAAHVQIHRADLLDILGDAVGRQSQIQLNCRCVAVTSSDRGATLTLGNGRTEEFDLVVGCDGIRSVVRTALHGSHMPRFTGNMCWRALIPVERVSSGHVPPDTTIWMGPGGHIVTYYVRAGALVNVVAVRETTDWVEDSWSVEARKSELVAAFPGVHRDLHELLEQAEHCFKWGLFDRDPLPTWSTQRITLLGDAAHPMLPFLGQGAAMAIEDAYVLARELARSPDDVAVALRAYEAERVPRTARVQLAARDQAKTYHMTSPAARLQRVLRHWIEKLDATTPTDVNTEWLYGYDPTRQPA